MKILYISHYKEASGWGQVARDYILALDQAGIDVVPHPIVLGNPTARLPKKIIELEQNDISNCNICIQHVLPHYMKCDRYFDKNIGIFETETSNIKYTTWPKYLNLMDETWVPNTTMLKDSLHDGITKPIKLVPHTFDTDVYDVQYEKLNLPIKDKFVFYFIGEFNKRKHLSALVKAFHIEFEPHEPVELVIKVNKFGISVEQLSEEIRNFCNSIKDNLRLYQNPYSYKPEILITTHISREDILRLHTTCDCFVCPSYGEAWCIPAFEAMGMGNMVIAGAIGGPLDYIDSERNGYLVGGSMEPVFGQNESFPEFGTARERWFEISTSQLMKTMRRVYNMDKNRRDRVSSEAKLSAKAYDYKRIGQHMKELLSV